MPEPAQVSRVPDDADLSLLGLSTATLSSERHDSPAFVDQILSKYGLKLEDVARASVGNNNSTFILSVSPSVNEPNESENKVQINWAGTVPIPTATTKLIFATAKVKEDMDHLLMVPNRVAAMKLVRDAGGHAAELVPRCFGWSDGSEAGEGHGKSWVLMEFVSGTNLGLLWDDLSQDQKLVSLRSVAKAFASLQQTPLPNSDTPYGAFTFVDPKSLTSKITYGPSCFHYGGPYATVKQLYAAYFTIQYEALKTRGSRLQGWRGSDVTLESGRRLDLSDALTEFYEIVKEDGERWAKLTEGFEAKNVLVHGDFMEINLFVDPESLEVTGILDFEFAQSGPPMDEYLQSLPTFGLLVLGKLREHQHKFNPALVFANPPELPEDAPDLDKCVQAFVGNMKEEGAIGPWSYDREVVDRMAGLYWFGYELCQGIFQREVWWSDANKEKRDAKLKEFREQLSKDVTMWLSQCETS